MLFGVREGSIAPSETPEPPTLMKIIRRTLALALLSLAATACGTSTILAPECEDESQCEYTPGPNSYTPGPNSYTPGPNS